MTRLGLVSDVHMHSEDREAVERNLRRVAGRFDRTGVDRALVLGDLVEDESAAADAEHVRIVRSVLETGGFPVTYLAGNHDVTNLSRAGLRGALDGDLWGRLTVDGHDLLYLDSSAPRLSGARGEIGDEQLAFLDRTLPDLEDALLFVHHPVCYLDLSDNYWFGEYPERALCGNKKEVNDVVEAHGGVRAAFSGHVHETRHVRYRGVDHVVLNAFNKELPDADVTGTYATVDLDSLAVDVCVGDRTVESFVLD